MIADKSLLSTISTSFLQTRLFSQCWVSKLNSERITSERWAWRSPWKVPPANYSAAEVTVSSQTPRQDLQDCYKLLQERWYVLNTEMSVVRQVSHRSEIRVLVAGKFNPTYCCPLDYISWKISTTKH